MRVLEIFKELTQIPRCSKTYNPFIDFVTKFIKEYDYDIQIDSVNNILVSKKNSKASLCLQAHYDIVCLEDGKVPIILEEDGYIKAKDSTLGADNGIGCAYMLAFIEQGKDLEYLFTSDEEIGLIGANGIEFNLISTNMLNLDSEDENGICIGCAGGVDIFASNNSSQLISNDENKQLYEITISNLDGGHSGVDIDKNIPNSIKLIAKTIKESNATLIDIKGGERINSIPKEAKAIVVSSSMPQKSHKNMQIKQLDTTTQHYKKLDDNIIDFLYSFASGVRGYDKELNVVLNSINLAKIDTLVDDVVIELSARSMDNDELKSLENETVVLLESFNFKVSTSGKYPAWKPSHNQFTTKVLDIYKKYNKNTTLEAIHAGLECAIFKDKYPNIQICSIGPNIYFPHSNREKCEISSIYRVFEVLKEIVSCYT